MKVREFIKIILLMTTLPLVACGSMFILGMIISGFAIAVDYIGNPILAIIISALLLAVLAIVGGIGKATGETFGAHKAKTLFDALTTSCYRFHFS